MRLELEVLSVSQTGFLFVVVVNIWGNWGPEQWLKQCRAKDKIWDLGKDGCSRLLPSFLSSLRIFFLSFFLFPPSVFSFFPSFSFLPSLLSFCLSFNEHHPLRIYFKEFEEEKYHWTKSREYQQGGASWMTSIPKTSQSSISWSSNLRTSQICLDLCPRARWTRGCLLIQDMLTRDGCKGWEEEAHVLAI